MIKEELALATVQQRQPPSSVHTSVVSPPCLVYSASEDQRRRLAGNAETVGWSVMALNDLDRAFVEIERVRFPFALIDLQSVTRTNRIQTQQLSLDLAKQRGSLLVVIGRPDHPSDEIWARQVGVWVYLPGLALEQHGTRLICDEALQFHLANHRNTYGIENSGVGENTRIGG